MPDDPFRKLDKLERDARRVANQPKREVRQVQNQARRAARAPGREVRQAKNRARQPGRRMKGQMRRMQGRGRRYKRYAGRMAGTDFMVSAMMYPIGPLSLVAGFVDDWDTIFIRYHTVHARMLMVTAILLFPLIPILWLYSWYLGFRAYSGKKTRIPLLTGFAEGRGWLDLEPVEE